MVNSIVIIPDNNIVVKLLLLLNYYSIITGFPAWTSESDSESEPSSLRPLPFLSFLVLLSFFLPFRSLFSSWLTPRDSYVGVVSGWVGKWLSGCVCEWVCVCVCVCERERERERERLGTPAYA